MTSPTLPFEHFAVRIRNPNSVRKIPRRESNRMVVTIARFDEIFRNQTVRRSMTVIATRNVMMRGLAPVLIEFIHHVAIVASAGVIP
jgi:hypothetical protein